MTTSKLDQLSHTLDIIQALIKKRLLVEIKKNLLSSGFMNSVITRSKQIVNQLQAGYFGGNAKDDKTAIGIYDSAIEAEIRKNIANFAANLTNAGVQSFDILSDEFIGVGKEGDKQGTTPIQWLIYFIDEGFEGKKLLWFNRELADKFDSNSKNLGRFGNGILIEVDDETALKYSSNLHPQSGKPAIGTKVFTDLIVANDFTVHVLAPAIASVQSYIDELLSKR